MRSLIVLTSLQFIASLTLLGVENPNLIKNSSFELGMPGFECNSLIFSRKNNYDRRITTSVDKNTKVHGNVSLKIDNSNGDYFKLLCDDIKLIPNNEYTVSLWMKSTKNNYPVLIALQSVAEGTDGKDEWNGPLVGFDLTKNWKRYSHKFKIPASGIHTHYNLSIGSNPTKPGISGTIWLDAIQVNIDQLKKYRPCSNTEGAISLNRPFAFYAPGEDINGTIKVIQYSGTSSEIVFSYSLINNYYKNIIFSKNIGFKTITGNPVTQTFSFKENNRGPYVLKAEIIKNDKKHQSVQPTYLAVSETGETEAPVNIDEFSIGINMSPHSVDLLGLPAIEPMLIRTSGFSNLYKYYAMQGVRWMRDWSNRPVFSWIDIEPEQGKFNWDLADRHVENALKNNIIVLPVLGGWGMDDRSQTKTWHWKEYPDWLIKRGTIQPAFHSYFAKKGHRLFLPNMEDWINFIKAVVGRYKGKITHYEILNEPNLYMPPNEYVKYLKAAYEAAKNVDPKCKIIGVCTTGDSGGDSVGFLEKCCKLDVLNYLDIVSFHPYNSRLSGTTISAQSAISDLKKLILQYGKKEIPLWNTEVFFLNPAEHTGVKAAFFRGNEIANRYFIDLGEGLGQSIPLNRLQLSQPTIYRNRFFYDRGTTLTPSGHSVIYATIAKLFKGAKPLKKLKWPGKNICYVFKQNEQLIAVVWNYDKSTSDILQSSELFSSVTIFDMFGNPVAKKENMNCLKLRHEPYYLFYNGKETKHFLTVLEHVKLNSESPIELSGAKIEKLNSALILTLELKNVHSAKAKGYVLIKSLPEGISTETEKVSYGPIVPHQKTLVSIPIKLKNRQQATGKIKLLISTGTKTTESEAELSCPLFLKCNQYKAKPVVDGYLSKKEWDYPEGAIVNQADSIKFGDRSTWLDQTDCSAAVKTCYDMTNIYFSFEVSDNIAGQRQKAKPWTGDTLELYIHTTPEPGKKHTDNTYRLFLSPASGTNTPPLIQLWQGNKISNASQITWSSTRNKKGYILEIAIPFLLLKLNSSKLSGTNIDFDFAINDSDLKGRENQLVWSGNGNNYKDRSCFGRLYFSKQSPCEYD